MNSQRRQLDSPALDRRRRRGRAPLPAWSPDGAKIVFASNAFMAPIRLRHLCHEYSQWETGVTRRIPLSLPDDLDRNSVTLLRVGYPPSRGTPSTLTLVPAFDECTERNGSHGPPLRLELLWPPNESSGSLR